MNITDEIKVLGKMTGVLAEVLGSLDPEHFARHAIAPSIRVMAMDRVELSAGGVRPVRVTLSAVVSPSLTTVTARCITADTGPEGFTFRCNDVALPSLAKDIIDSIG